MDTDFSGCSTERLQYMAEAAETVIDCHRVLAKTGDSIVGELLKTREHYVKWQHYPKGDIYDKEFHCQAYYHSHGEEKREGENGHFHCFLDKDARPENLTPIFRPGPKSAGKKKGKKETLTHLVGISINETSIPHRLFTVNRWVTDEVLYSAQDMIAMIDLFEIDIAQPSWPVNQWLTGMVRLFRPQIEQILIERDETYAAYAETHPEVENIYNDRDLEITSQIEISVDDQVQAILAELERRGEPWE